jgi:hypothetical protein
MPAVLEPANLADAGDLSGSNRLAVICHEDLDTLAAPHLFPFLTA